MDKRETGSEGTFEFIKINRDPYTNNLFMSKQFESNKNELSKIISNVLNNSEHKQIKFNVNVSQNYFNSNINYIVSQNEVKSNSKNTNESPSIFFSKMYSAEDSLNKAKSSPQKKKNSDKKVDEMAFSDYYVPCINCNNLIHVDETGIYILVK
jgi:hypothetical protein